MAPTTDFKPGDMDVASQRSMYSLFNALLHWGGLALATLLIFLVLLLCAGAGFFPSIVVAAIVLVAGVIWLRKPKAH